MKLHNFIKYTALQPFKSSFETLNWLMTTRPNFTKGRRRSKHDFAIVEQNVLSGQQFQDIKRKLWQDLLPILPFTSEGHDAASKESQQAAKKYFK